ncbi:hypothetical protein L596_013412 [Steinernema carpocapsae]|uniref:Uncharacterized protein n=1 Tax=Steinernema carpocapsae TaxID=34508 RepID=A0A4U5P0Y2_STECR|nr:hypothetical protein L596_013412 [Steinernema carpocapsae]
MLSRTKPFLTVNKHQLVDKFYERQSFANITFVVTQRHLCCCTQHFNSHVNLYSKSWFSTVVFNCAVIY